MKIMPLEKFFIGSRRSSRTGNHLLDVIMSPYESREGKNKHDYNL